MTTYLSITEVKRDWYEVMDRVGAGEDIIVTKWGRPTVRLAPFPSLNVVRARTDPPATVEE